MAEPDDWKRRDRLHPADDGEDNLAFPEAARNSTGEDGIEGEDVALALPRGLLALPRAVIVTAFVPLRGLLHLVGRYQIPERVVDLLYNDERTAAIIPSISFFGSQGLTVGATAFHEGWGKHHERIALSAKFGDRYQAVELDFTAPHVAGTFFGVEVTTRFERGTRRKFHGYGPQEAEDAEDRPPSAPVGPRDAHVETEFEQTRALTMLRAGFELHESVNLGAVGILNARSFGPDRQEGGEPSIEQVYDTSQLTGFDDGYELGEALLDFRVDARVPPGATESGIYLHAFGGGAPPQNGYQFIHYGAVLAGYIDLYAGDRVLVLRAAHEAMFAGDDQIPWADMPRLGGPQALRGYDLHRFRDKNTAVVTAEYHYPIHEYVAGLVFVDVGSVGRDYEVMINPDNYRVGAGGGLMIRTKESKLFTIQVGVGDGVQVFFTSDPIPAFSKRFQQL